MKKSYLVLISLTISLLYSQNVVIKDGETIPNTLIQINDEGMTGSIELPSGETPTPTLHKLYNVGGTLYWSGNTLATGSSLWTLSSGNVYRSTGKVGIGTASPIAKLHVNGDDGLLIQGTLGSGIMQNLGSGTRLHFYSKIRAFRAGYVDGTQWNHANIGASSIAMGRNTLATGFVSTAIGETTKATGDYSTAMGHGSTASGDYSTAMGHGSTASGDYSTAMGIGTQAESYYSTAIGRFNVGGGLPTAYGANDPVFEIGIGSSDGDRKNAFTVTKRGRVGIGKKAYSYPLEIYSNIHYWDDKFTHHIQLEVDEGSWLLGVDNQAGDADFLFRSSEDSDGYTALIDAASGGYILTSDKRLKKNIEPLSNMLDKIQQLEPVSFHRLTQDDNEQRELGFLAQDVNKIFLNTKIAKLKGDYWTLTYDNFGTIAIAGIKELKDKTDREIQELKKENEELNLYMTELTKRIKTLENR